MSVTRTFADVKKVILSAHRNTEADDKVGVYDTWADNYDQVMCKPKILPTIKTRT